MGLTLDVCLIIMIGGFVGARLFHVLYESPRYYQNAPIEILKIWQGGFVYYGGLIGAALAVWIFLRRKNQSFLLWADFFTPLLAFGYAGGRMACFLNGCCHGTHCDLPWAMDFSSSGLEGLRHPTQLYASAWEFGLLTYLLVKENGSAKMMGQKEIVTLNGSLFLTWIFLHSVGRILMEFYRDDYRGNFIFGLSPATLISLLLIAAATTVYSYRHFKS